MPINNINFNNMLLNCKKYLVYNQPNNVSITSNFRFLLNSKVHSDRDYLLKHPHRVTRIYNEIKENLLYNLIHTSHYFFK
jgi:hypothetical protein